MRAPRRLAAALALALSLGASGCASLNFSPGCGFGLGSDPMADGASRMNRTAEMRGHIRAQHQAYQRKALMTGTGSSSARNHRKPGDIPPAATQPATLCVR
jgi:hypothetical protein